ncbi:MAG TPA: protein kinase [Candidatus Sulfopaludibacter sp.]|jgi:dienelactone hydrolase|nr:protein kinase [Candidatus Sulfopaludibacter sp.]
MTPSRWQRIETLFHEALGRIDEERTAFLEGACEGDDELRREVESLLTARSSPLDRTPFEDFPVPPRSDLPLREGMELGPYRIDGRIGAGGMGEVYRATDKRLGRAVAVKISNEPLLGCVEREARAISALNHPNICTLYDVGPNYLVMELLEGEPLNAVVRRGPLPAAEILDIARQVTSALDCAHRQGIIHRDLKPANLFRTSSGPVKVLDFGIARYHPEGLPAEAGFFVGTPAYASPEQLRGEAIDARSDLFSLGVVLYELTTGTRPCSAASLGKILSSDRTVTFTPPSRKSKGADPRLDALILRLLDKEPERRFPSAAATHEAILELQAPRRMPYRWAAVAALVAVLAVSGGLWRRSRRAAAAERELPKLLELVDHEENFAAAQLATRLAAIIPANPLLAQARARYSRLVTIRTDPPGADVYRKPYGQPKASWTHLGRTPLEKLAIPRGYARWKIELAGYQTMEFAASPADYFRSSAGAALEEMNFSLDRPGDLPEGMVRVKGGKTNLAIPGLEGIPAVDIPDYFMDRYEVSNGQFKAFVDAGGYTRPEFWKYRFVRNGETLPFSGAMLLLRDRTGRPGPAGWELSEFPKGQGEYPATGVSWYEAAAYAEFAHASLPNAYQWSRAAGTHQSEYIIPFANFSGALRSRGNSQAIAPSGIFDSAGNAKEWCSNESGAGHLILGGGYNEPVYMFNDWDSKAPFERDTSFGFRLAKDAGTAAQPETATRPIPTAHRDFRTEKPVSDSTFQIYRSLYAYDKTPLEARIESTEDFSGYRLETVSYRAGYGTDRVTAFVATPKTGTPPYQTVVVFPGANWLHQTTSRIVRSTELPRWDYLLKAGRAMVIPIYKGTLERTSDLASDHPAPTGLYRDHVLMWSKDLGRTVDYVETRPDLDRNRIAFYGFSWGGAMGAILPALEPRLKVLVLESGGLYNEKPDPEVDQINFAPHIQQPVLMIDAHYDHFFPLETSQIPLFHLFGAPEKAKRHVVVEYWHAIPRHVAVREALPWLDRYLGPVK